MTYPVNDTTIMALVDTGGVLTVSHLLIFIEDRKVVPVSSIIPTIQSVYITENIVLNCYNVVMEDANGYSTSVCAPGLEDVAAYIIAFIPDAPLPLFPLPFQRHRPFPTKS